MVRRRGAARQQQLGVVEQGRRVQILVGQRAHQAAQIAQPGKQGAVLQAGDVAKQALKLVMVGVDQPWQDHSAGEVEPLIRGWRGLRAPTNRLDAVVVDEHPGVAQAAAFGVERRERVDVMEKQTGHGRINPRNAPRASE